MQNFFFRNFFFQKRVCKIEYETNKNEFISKNNVLIILKRGNVYPQCALYDISQQVCCIEKEEPFPIRIAAFESQISSTIDCKN